MFSWAPCWARASLREPNLFSLTDSIGGVFAIGDLGSPLLFAGAVAAGALATAGAVVVGGGLQPDTRTRSDRYW